MPLDSRDAAHLWDMLAHEYGRIDPALLYRAARESIPRLIMYLEQVVGSAG